jgi:pyridoxamine--pyruvate transaminase
VEQPAYPASADPAFNLTGGPSGATAATLAALGRPILHHLDPAFGAFYQRTAELLQQAFGTRESPVILPGEAVVGLEAAAASLIGPEDVVLNLVSGIYGRGYGEWARRYAREVVEVEVPYDSSVPPASVADVMRGRPDITVVSVVHCETPTGTVNDLDAISAVVAEHGALLIVDAVSSFGGIPLRLHLLAGRPGGDRAAEMPGRYARTVPAPYLREGAGAVLQRHRAAARAARAGAEALGLTLWARDPLARSDTVTAVRVPDGIDEREVRTRAREDSGVMLSGGQGDLARIVLQIGHMGTGAYPLGPVVAVTAIGRALRSVGAQADIGAAVEAALAALQA